MALEGTLHDMSLSDLIQIFRMGPKTGVLLLINNDERGVIYVAAGRLIDAAIVRGTIRTVVATRDDAVIQMLTWDEASFIFRHDPAVSQRAVRIEHDSEWLVLEGMRRRADPTRALPYHTITLDTRLQLAPLPSSAESGVSLDVVQWRILSQVSSCQDLRAICAVAGIEPAQAIRTVAELLSIGLVEIVPQQTRPAPHYAHDRQIAHSDHLLNRLEPALASVGHCAPTGNDTPDQPTTIGRGLLNAIMRRIRGL